MDLELAQNFFAEHDIIQKRYFNNGLSKYNQFGIFRFYYITWQPLTDTSLAYEWQDCQRALRTRTEKELILEYQLRMLAEL